jgi:hypothetical protein
MESGLHPRHHEQGELDAARAVWDELAARARSLHCPEHFVEPWRVVVIGDRPDRLRLQIYGCCARLQAVVNEMIGSDPRVSGPG